MGHWDTVGFPPNIHGFPQLVLGRTSTVARSCGTLTEAPRRSGARGRGLGALSWLGTNGNQWIELVEISGSSWLLVCVFDGYFFDFSWNVFCLYGFKLMEYGWITNKWDFTSNNQQQGAKICGRLLGEVVHPDQGAHFWLMVGKDQKVPEGAGKSLKSD